MCAGSIACSDQLKSCFKEMVVFAGEAVTPRFQQRQASFVVRDSRPSLGTRAEELIFSSPKGRFSIHPRRLANYEDLTQYALRRVSPAAVGRRR